MLLSKDKVNTGRQIEVDLLKAFTVVFSMIIIHVYDYDTVGLDNQFTWLLDNIFGGIFAAPMFMFCMGLGMVYSRNSSPGQMAVRGLKLLTIGQVLNLFRYSIIFAVQSLLHPESDFTPAQALNLSSDIMQLAGLSFLLMALFCKLNMKNYQVFLAAAVLNVCGTLLEKVQTGCYGFDQVLGLFWGTDTESFFPLFNWFIFIAAGKCFGSFFQRVADKKVLYSIAIPVSVVIFATTWYFQKCSGCNIFKSFTHEGFSWMALPDALSVILMAPGVIGIFYLISRALPNKTTDVLSHPSKHINQYYCVSWWWIMIVYLVVWENTVQGLISIWLNILMFTIVSVVLYNNHFKTKVESFCSNHRTVLTMLVWVITLGLAFYSFVVCNEFPNLFNDYLME